MVIPSLERSVLDLFKNGLAPSSAKAYASARFNSFCQKFNVPAPFPLSEATLCYFVSHLHEEGLKHQTIKCYLSGLRHAQIAAGLQDLFSPQAPSRPRLEYVLKGIKRQQAKAGAKSNPRLPITPAILRKLCHQWDSTGNRDSIMLRAASCVSFFGFLRTAEFTVPPGKDAFDPQSHLSLTDVAVDCRNNPSTVRIRVKKSKTDPFRQGVDIYLGRSHSDICPVTSMAHYLTQRGAAPGPLFLHADSQPLTRSSLVTAMKEALAKAGLDPTLYNGHSFRIGAATTAASNGVEDAIIQTLGRWQSSAYLRYVKIPRERLAAISQVMAQ